MNTGLYRRQLGRLIADYEALGGGLPYIYYNRHIKILYILGSYSIRIIIGNMDDNILKYLEFLRKHHYSK